MKKLIVLFALTLAFSSCKNKSEETKETVEPIEIAPSQSLLELGCYAYKSNNSSVTFEIITIHNDIVKGKLDYHLAEKDANVGTFEGVLVDDVLLGDYTFQSEGVISKREVIFKIINGQLIEGYGDMNEDGTQFINTDHVTFSSIMPLTKTDCVNYTVMTY